MNGFVWLLYGSLIITLAVEEGSSEEETAKGYLRKISALYRKKRTRPIPATLSLRRTIDIEDDIKLTTGQAKAIYEFTIKDLSGNNQGRKKREIENNFAQKWDLPIQYKFDGTHSSTEKAKIREAIGVWSKETCVEFKEIDKSQNPSKTHLVFIKSSGCWSYVGKTQMQIQEISLGTGCFSIGTRLHEIGHALGFFHEQSRYDRDNFITLNFDNIYPGRDSQFYKVGPEEKRYTPYDFASMMHYPITGFSIDNAKPVIETKEPIFTNTPGQRLEMTFLDAKAMNMHYCQSKCTGKRMSRSCQNGGYQDPKRCTHCRCPDGFTGQFCEQLKRGKPLNCSAKMVLLSGDTKNIEPFTGLTMRFEQECSWLIEAPSNEKVTATVTSTGRLSCHPKRLNCLSWVEIRYNGKMDESGPRFCECAIKSSLRTVTSTGNKLLILLRTPQSAVRPPKIRIEVSGQKSRWTTWSTWSRCSKQCGSGSQARTRRCTGGAGSCTGAPHQTRTCNTQQCVGSWTGWGKCSRTCSGGIQVRTRTCSGICQGGVRQTRRCNANACRGTWMQWNAWGSCSKSCGYGYRIRTRSCKGSNCPGALQQTSTCNNPCSNRSWTTWTQCSSTCNWGTQTRSRGQRAVTRRCYAGACKAGRWGSWNSWSPVCRNCNSVQRRQKKCLPIGMRCVGQAPTQTRTCTIRMRNCQKVDGRWSRWTSYSRCSKTCGSGIQTRTRQCNNPSPQKGGQGCPGPNTNNHRCSQGACRTSPGGGNGLWNTWGPQGGCSKDCNGIQRERRRCRPLNIWDQIRMAFGALRRSELCRHNSVQTRTKTCNRKAICDGKTGIWNKWTECSKTCDSGTESRLCIPMPQRGPGNRDPIPIIRCKPGETQTRRCNKGDCLTTQTRLTSSKWASWSRCSRTCGKGIRRRLCEPVLQRDPAGRPVSPPVLQDCLIGTVQTESCHKSPCAFTNTFWGAYGACSVTCGSGHQTRECRRVPSRGVSAAVVPIHNNRCSLGQSQTRTCAKEACQGPNRSTYWGNWSPCSNSCSQRGVRTRICAMLPPPPPLGPRRTPRPQVGPPCQFGMRETKQCGGGNGRGCPQNKRYRWSRWSDCSTTCNSGRQTRTCQRIPQRAPDGTENQGGFCPTLGQSQTKSCSNRPCEQKPSTYWGSWGVCSATCGSGVLTRVCKRVPQRGMSSMVHAMPNQCTLGQTETKTCNNQNCGPATYWSNWRSCSMTCGRGTRTRTCARVPPGSNIPQNGPPCSFGNIETESCQKTACPSKPKNRWGHWSQCSVTCGSGYQERKCEQIAPERDPGSGGSSSGREVCRLGQSQTKRCSRQSCPPDTYWGAYEACSVTCGTGTKIRTCRRVVPSRDFVNSGEQRCSLGATQTAKCVQQRCPAATRWGRWTECSVSCSFGTKTRICERIPSRDVSSDNGNQRPCNLGQLQTIRCHQGACPQRLRWSFWSACSKTCGSGNQNRVCVVAQTGRVSNETCGALGQLQTNHCSNEPCEPVIRYRWSNWIGCSASCGSGVQTRKCQLIPSRDDNAWNPSPDASQSCKPGQTQSRTCSNKPCVQNYRWSAWTICSTTCGSGGSQRRVCQRIPSRDATGESPNSDSSQSCSPGQSQTKACSNKPCESRIKYRWSQWSSCSTTCGSGHQQRTCQLIPSRDIGGASPNSDSNQPCSPRQTQTKACSNRPCEPRIRYRWSHWTVCSTSCGRGSQSRVCQRIPQRDWASVSNQTQPCTQGQTETKQCSKKSCVEEPRTRWSGWGACDKTCGSIGIQIRTCERIPQRDVTSDVQSAPNRCQLGQTETKTCSNQKACPVATQWGRWSGTCSVTCGNGLIKRRCERRNIPEREIASDSTDDNKGGQCMLGQEETKQCRKIPCGVKRAQWAGWTTCSQTCDTGLKSRTCVRLPERDVGDIPPTPDDDPVEYNCTEGGKQEFNCRLRSCGDPRCDDTTSYLCCGARITRQYPGVWKLGCCAGTVFYESVSKCCKNAYVRMKFQDC